MKNFLKFILPLILATQMTARAGRIEIRSTGQGASWVHLRDGAVAPTESNTPSKGLTGLAFTSADFDEDGVPDLVAGYANPATGGTLSIQRGNVDAIYPNSPEAQARRERGEFTAAAFLPGAKSFTVPEAADFIGAGDFDADGHWDIVTARKGGDKLYWFRGDGHGGFAEAKTIILPGAITSLITGEMNRADGLTDITVGIVTKDGACVLVFESPVGALRGAPETFPLPAAAKALALGQLDDDGMPDLAVASGNEVLIIHGRDRKLSLDAEHRADVKPAEVSRTVLDSPVLSVAVGDFVGNPGQKVAALTADGRVRVLERDGHEAMTLSVATGLADSTPPTRILTAKVSSLSKSDLLVFGGTNAVQILTATPAATTKNLTSGAATQMNVAASLTWDSEVAAVLPMRLNADALQSLVMVMRNSVTPSVVVPQAAATFVVNVEGNTNDKTPGDGICADDAGNCSFNAALQEANAHPGADTINFNIPGGGVHTLFHASGQYANEAVTIDGTTQPDGRIELAANGDYPIAFYGGNSVLRGVAAYGSSSAIVLPTGGNIIEGNYIGFRADGTKPVGFGANGDGIYFQGGVNGSLQGGNNLIGGTTAQARNVISNCVFGIYLTGAKGNVIEGNYIGTNVAGTAALPNNYAIRGDSTPDVIIGGTAAGAGNLISGNTGSYGGAIYIPSVPSALVQGNLIGTTADGMLPLANSGPGVEASNSGVTIGGTTPAARNVIAASSVGIFMGQDSAGRNELVEGNFIGTNAAGTGALPNLSHGIELRGPVNVTIGGTATGAGNLISGNGEDGISVAGGVNNVPSSALIQGNLIGTDVNGVVAIPNLSDGIQLPSSAGTVIGGTNAAARNVISGNHDHGIHMTAGANSGLIQGNYIGLNRFGTGALGNNGDGMFFDNFTQGNTVGGTAAGASNTIAFNRGAGIATANGYLLTTDVVANSIHDNGGLGIDLGSDGVTKNTLGSNSNYPVITSVESSDTGTTIQGTLQNGNYTAGITYTLQFYSNSRVDPSGYGEGQTYIGQTTITTDGPTTPHPFSLTVTPAVPPGRFITATALGKDQFNSPGYQYQSEFSFAGRVAGVATPQNTPLTLNVITPMIGGDSGSVTVSLIGEGIQSGATVILRRAGQADIIGTVVSASSDGSRIDVTFDLAGKPQGGWTVIATNPGGATASLGNAFTIEQGRGSQVWGVVTGANFIRVGRTARYFVTYGNSGNTDADPTLVRIYVPAGLEVGPTQRLEDGSFPAVYPDDAETVLEFYVPRIAPGSASSTMVLVKSDLDFVNVEAGMRVAVLSSPAYKAATDLHVDPSVSVVEETLDAQPTFNRTKLTITGPVSGELIRETRLEETSEFHELSFQVDQVDGLTRYTTAYTVPSSVVSSTFSSAAFKTGNSSQAAASSIGGGQINAASVSVTTILPDRGGGAISVTLRGQGFHAGMSVKLSRTGFPDVVAKAVSPANNGLSALVYFSLKTTPPGVYDLVITSANKTTYRLPKAFTVLAAFVKITDEVKGEGSKIAVLLAAVAMSPEVINQERGTAVPEANGDAASVAQQVLKNTLPQSPRRPANPRQPDARRLPGEAKKDVDTRLDEKVRPQELPRPDRPDAKPPEVPTRKPEGSTPFLPFQPPTPTPGPSATPPPPSPTPNPTPAPKPRPFPFNIIDFFNHPITPIFARDPNGKFGPDGKGAARYISGNDPMNYTIQFENQATATAPAQEVVITDKLDVSKYDLSTFQLGTISFGNVVAVTPPPGLSEWTTDIDLRPAQNLLVRVAAALDKTTGVITWSLISLDPGTKQPTENASAGFLPPNNNPPEGDGAVVFTVNAKRGLPAGTEIRNKARIVFDVNPPIDTPEWLNTIDDSVPTSQVEALPASSTSSEFQVRWSGTDTGAGIETYSIYVSENGGAYTLWLTTTETSAFYQGRPNASYRFFSVAQDGAGNTEAPPLPADAFTTTLSGQLLNIATRLRVQTGENVLIGGLIVTGTDQKRVILRAIGPSLSAAFAGVLANPKLELFQGNTLLASNDDWKDSQQAEIEATTIAPTNELESAIVWTLAPGSYTAVMSGKDGGTGIGVVEVYDLDQAANSKLANIATRGFVDTDDNVMIGGVIAGGKGGADTRVLIRAIGPSLANSGITGALQDPMLELRDANGAMVRQNDNWQTDQQSEIEATTIPPVNAAEAAIVVTLTPGNYTAIVRGRNNTTGVGLVEVYNVQ